MDESVDDDETWALAGYVADVESWARFSVEWERMLPRGAVTEDGVYHFKMALMAQSPERMGRVPGFYRLIEKHALHSLSCRTKAGELRRAIERIHVRGARIDWGDWKDPYTAAFRAFMDHFHYNRPAITKVAPNFPADAVVDFYFDERSDKQKIRRMWDGYMAHREPEMRPLFGHEPRFEDDRAFLPLQAADLWAWWIRKWSVEGNLRERIGTLDFGEWQGRGLPRTHISLTEDQWVEGMADNIAPQVPATTPIFDRKTGAVIRFGARRP